MKFGLSKEEHDLYSILKPDYLNHRNNMVESFFAHYTDADTASKIIKNNEIWLRDTRCMNDLSEMKHGFNSFKKSINNLKETWSLFEKLDRIEQGLSENLQNNINNFEESFGRIIYISCFSKHNANDNEHGKLSMWRAYGKKTPVAIIIKPEYLIPDQVGALQLYPVDYLSDESVENNLKETIKKLYNNISQTKSIANSNDGSVDMMLLLLLLETKLSTKHPGFKEEQEWRLCYIPKFKKSEDPEPEIVTINGLPQKVVKTSLSRFSKKNTNIIEKVIIGPTNDSEILKESFIDLLEKRKYENPENMIHISDIPLRTY